MTTCQCYRSPDGRYLCTPPSLNVTLPPLVSPKWQLHLAITSTVKMEEVNHSDSRVCFFSKLLLLGHAAILNCKEVWGEERGVRMSVEWGQPNHSVCCPLVGPVCEKSLSSFLPPAGLVLLNNGVNFRLS